MAEKKKFAGHNDSGNPTDVAYQFTVKTTASGGVQLGTFTNDTIGTTAEDGFIVIDVNGTEYKIPFWQDNV